VLIKATIVYLKQIIDEVSVLIVMPEKPTQTYVLVTGANGFLASNVIVELLSKGYAVRGVLRDLKNLSYLTHPNLDLVQGDFTEEKFIEKAMRGCDYVIHAAAIKKQRINWG